MREVAMNDGDEYDALTKGGRRFHAFRAGARAWIKRKFRRRERRVGEHEVKNDPTCDCGGDPHCPLCDVDVDSDDERW